MAELKIGVYCVSASCWPPPSQVLHTGFELHCYKRFLAYGAMHIIIEQQLPVTEQLQPSDKLNRYTLRAAHNYVCKIRIACLGFIAEVSREARLLLQSYINSSKYAIARLHALENKMKLLRF